MRVVQRLLTVPNIDINAVTHEGSTPLYAAAAGGHLEIVEILLALPNIEMNVVTYLRSTLLHAAAAGGT